MSLAPIKGLGVENTIRLNRFVPRSYQLPICNAFENEGYKKLLIVMPRRSGKDIVMFNLMVRAALRRKGIYFYILPNAVQARRVMFEGITSEGQRIIEFIPKEIIKKINIQQMKVELINDSIISFVGSENYDGLRGTNPVGCVFSEYAYTHPQAYPTIRPVLAANDGWVAFVSCVAPDTLVIGENGLCRIKNISQVDGQYTPYNKKIFGLGGFHNATHFYYGQKTFTNLITLSNGYSLECTPIHPIWNGTEWIKSKDLKIGDLIPIQYGQNIWPTDSLDISGFNYKDHGNIKDLLFDIGSSDFFYILGLIHADGNYDKNKICITNKKDPQIIDYLHSKGFKTRKDGIHHELSSKPLCALLEYLGFKHGAKNKVFPEKLLNCCKADMISFLQGVFDGDGSSHSDPAHRGRIAFHSACKKFMEALKVILLNFGIVSSLRMVVSPPSKKVKVESTIFTMEISGYFAHTFYEVIGFRLERKQKNKQYISSRCKEDHESMYPIDISRLDGYKIPKNIVTNPRRVSRRVIRKLYNKKPHDYLKELLSEKFFYAPIVSIEQRESEVYDFVIPETHSFFSNGFISHNTPFGENHFYTLYEIAKNSPKEWFTYFLTIKDTRHISELEIREEVERGEISADMAEQEYYCSFSIGAIGAYYAKYLNRMELNNQITTVDWEPNFPVHTAWDIAMKDQTVILMFQCIGRQIHIIDMYKNSDVGLEHYINVLKSKEYTWGKHIAPHDIAVREWTSGGLTRLEKARQLGFNFEVADKLSIMDGIEAVRSTLSRIYIDSVKCKSLVAALRNYRKEYDSKLKVYKEKPLHDYNSDIADALRYLCISLPKTSDGLSAQELEKQRHEALYGDQLPNFFNHSNRY